MVRRAAVLLTSRCWSWQWVWKRRSSLVEERTASRESLSIASNSLLSVPYCKGGSGRKEGEEKARTSVQRHYHMHPHTYEALPDCVTPVP